MSRMEPREPNKNPKHEAEESKRKHHDRERESARIVDVETASASPERDEEVENAGEPDEKFLHPDEEEQEEEAEAGEARYLRLAADFDNYRKRMVREMALERQRGRRDAAERLLPVYDSLAVGLTQVKDDESPARAGMLAVQAQLLGAFEQLGLRKIPTVGERFDPELHEAIQQMPHSEFEEGVVCMEARAGFVDEQVGLLRPAQVIVSSGSPE